MNDFKCVLSRVVLYTRSTLGENILFCNYDVLVPSSLGLSDALSFAEFTAKEMLRKEDHNVVISDVAVSFRKSHQSAEDPSVLP